MADAADVGPSDIVVEVGPGTGMLTKELLERGASVFAIEADLRAIETLSSLFAREITAQKLTLIHADMRTFELTSLKNHLAPHDYTYKIVSNIPYYLSGMLFRTFLETSLQPTDLVFLVQKEVAERIARDKKESLLSLSVKVYGDPHYVKTIARGNFSPPPKVDSAIVSVRKISKERLGSLSERDFFTLIHAGFASKRKQLLGNLTSLVPREQLHTLFLECYLPLDVRGEDLSLSSWILLGTNLASHLIDTK
jgi:16S rRNA (adenine1518-N6/adenine1519-N6)-dimethyltransferase